MNYVETSDMSFPANGGRAERVMKSGHPPYPRLLPRPPASSQGEAQPQPVGRPFDPRRFTEGPASFDRVTKRGVTKRGHSPYPLLLPRPPASAQGEAQPQPVGRPFDPRRFTEGPASFDRLPGRRQRRGIKRLVHDRDPIHRARQGAVGQQRPSIGGVWRAEARPTPSFRTADEAGSQRIGLHIPQQRVVVGIVLNREGFEPALVNMPLPDRVPVLPPAPDVGVAEPSACRPTAPPCQTAGASGASDWASGSTPAAARRAPFRPCRQAD